MKKLIKQNSKKLIQKTKPGHLNDKNVVLKNNEKKKYIYIYIYITVFQKNYVKNRVQILKIYI